MHVYIIMDFGTQVRNNNQAKHRTHNGYTILELSISLSIIAFLFTLGIGFFGKINEADRYKKTLEHVALIENAIKNYYNVNGFLPCPAPGNSLEYNAGFGYSTGVFNVLSNECDITVINATGMVPVRTLQINDEVAYDGWNRKFTYRLAKGLGSTATFNGLDSSNSPYNGDIRVVNIEGQDLTNINASPPNNFGAAYVIISHGPNGEEAAWGKNTAINPAGASGIEAENTNHSSNKTYIQAVRTARYDDIVAFKQKNYFTANKNGRSPIFVEPRICDNATTILTKPISSSGSITAAFIDQVVDSAVAVRELCNNPTAFCAFRPSDIANLTVWLDANDPSGNGIAPALGAFINTIYNKTGSGTNAVASSSGQYWNVPEYSKNGILFNSDNSYYQINLAPLNTDFSIFYVGKMRNGGIAWPHSGVYGGCNTATNELIAGLFNKNLITQPFLFNADTNKRTSIYLSICGQQSLGMYLSKTDYYNQPVIIELNYNLTAPPLYGLNIFFYNKDGLFLHENNSIPWNANYVQSAGLGLRFGMSGFLGEYLVYNRSLTMLERSKVTEYLMNRWFTNVCN
ncbi:type II secretion system protein [Rickettsiales endosymbiont of Stachyamoeba lipophora]|nr:type II secretion system protein [Rickettsiales endosymbiont of Stachyamoeba lipophora]